MYCVSACAGTDRRFPRPVAARIASTARCGHHCSTGGPQRRALPGATDTAGFQLTELAYGHTEAGFFYASYSFSSAEHGGTHLDAPIHFAQGRRTADQIPLSSLITTASEVDVSDAAAADSDYQLTVEDLTAWEAEHGRLASRATSGRM